MTIEEYFNKCKGFDWYYTMSDDHRVWRSGEQAKRALKREAETDLVKSEIFKDWESFYFSGKPFGTTRTPEPSLADYIGLENI